LNPTDEDDRPDDPADLAALYLVGALEPDECAAFEARLDAGDRACLDALIELAPALEALLEALPPLEPPPEVRTALLAMVEQAAEGRAESIHSEAVEVRTAAEAKWMPTTSRGVTIRSLHSDPVDGMETLLLSMKPGAILKAHFHGSAGEECYMIEGDAFSAGYALKAGDYQRLPAGRHGPVTTRGGCLALIRVSRK
jgi:hypothetical protein